MRVLTLTGCSCTVGVLQGGMGGNRGHHSHGVMMSAPGPSSTGFSGYSCPLSRLGQVAQYRGKCSTQSRCAACDPPPLLSRGADRTARPRRRGSPHGLTSAQCACDDAVFTGCCGVFVALQLLWHRRSRVSVHRCTFTQLSSPPAALALLPSAPSLPYQPAPSTHNSNNNNNNGTNELTNIGVDLRCGFLGIRTRFDEPGLGFLGACRKRHEDWGALVGQWGVQRATQEDTTVWRHG